MVKEDRDIQRKDREMEKDNEKGKIKKTEKCEKMESDVETCR